MATIGKPTVLELMKALCIKPAIITLPMKFLVAENYLYKIIYRLRNDTQTARRDKRRSNDFMVIENWREE